MRYAELVENGRQKIRQVGMEAYLDLGAETHSQNRLNRAYTDSLTLEMRILGSQPATLETELFGCKLRTPITGSGICASRVLEALGPWDVPYLELVAGGLADAGSLMSTGDVTFDQLGRIVDQGAPVLHMIKPYTDPERVLSHITEAERLGCVAVGMDVDVMYQEKAWDEVPGPDHLGPQTLDLLRGFIEAASVPFLIKGVLSEHDARQAKELGADGVVVSNHGGEAIDYTVPVLLMLPRVREAIPDLTILADSGFRRGTDVLKALALGAEAVGIVTLLVIACAADGRAGVRLMIELLNEELERTMSFVGARSVSQVDPTIVHIP